MVFPDRIVVSYHKTICFNSFYENQDKKEELLKQAKQSAFDYGVTFGTVHLSYYEIKRIKTDEEIFQFLETYKF